MCCLEAGFAVTPHILANSGQVVGEVFRSVGGVDYVCSIPDLEI